MLTAAFGLRVDLDLPHPALGTSAALPAGPTLRATLATPADVAAAWSGSCSPPRLAAATVDDIPWELERGRRGDARVTHGQTRLHLDSKATLLLCAPEDPASAAWQRVLLDTALVTASLIRGLDALHAGAVSVEGACVALLGARGTGKTSITLELVRREARLVADDVVAIAPSGDGAVIAHPAPALANLPAKMPVDGLGDVLHDFGDELWIRVDRAASGPQPLTAVVLVERVSGDAAPRLEPIDEPAVALLSHALHSGIEPSRRAQRFALVGDLADTATVLRLVAPEHLAPPLLAELVRDELLT